MELVVIQWQHVWVSLSYRLAASLNNNGGRSKLERNIRRSSWNKVRHSTPPLGPKLQHFIPHEVANFQRIMEKLILRHTYTCHILVWFSLSRDIKGPYKGYQFWSSCHNLRQWDANRPVQGHFPQMRCLSADVHEKNYIVIVYWH